MLDVEVAVDLTTIAYLMRMWYIMGRMHYPGLENYLKEKCNAKNIRISPDGEHPESVLVTISCFGFNFMQDIVSVLGLTQEDPDLTDKGQGFWVLRDYSMDRNRLLAAQEALKNRSGDD